VPNPFPFSFFCCVHVFKLFLLQSFPSLLYLPCVPSNWFSIFFSRHSHILRFLIPTFPWSMSLLSLTMLYSRVYIILFFRFLLNFFDSGVRPSVECDFFVFLQRLPREFLIWWERSYSTAFSLTLFFGLRNFLFLILYSIYNRNYFVGFL